MIEAHHVELALLGFKVGLEQCLGAHLKPHSSVRLLAVLNGKHHVNLSLMGAELFTKYQAAALLGVAALSMRF